MNDSPSPMPEAALCPQCGRVLDAAAPGGLCPACLLQQGVAGDTMTGGGVAFKPPSVVEMAERFPQLEILEFIGRGGMGAVYKARQRELDRIVALKVLPPGVGETPSFTERFTREARALAKLNHPNIVTLYEFGQAGGLYFFLMEYVDGVNLRQLLDGGRIAPREALAIVPQICDALQFAHDHRIVHRDIKPENILLDRRGHVKVADFGLAKIMEGEDAAAAAVAGAMPEQAALSQMSKIMGTPNYMSPEQLERPDDVDHRADIYALGVVFYQMLTGELPGNPVAPPSSRPRAVEIDVRLDEVVLRALQKNPARRYAQASVMKTQVEAIADDPEKGPKNADDGDIMAFVWKLIPIVAVLLAFYNPWGAQGWFGFAAACAVLSLLPSLGLQRWLKAKQNRPARQKTGAAPASESRPRFSLLAVVGACWIPFVFAAGAFIAWEPKHARFPYDYNYTATVRLFLSLAGCFGTTILGWMAVAQIRRSAGQLHGLWLAVFDGLLFPLLIMDLAINFCAAKLGEALLWGVAASPAATRFAPYHYGFIRLLEVLIVLAALAANFFIVRRVWRAVNRPLTGSGIPSSAVVSASRGGWRWARSGLLVVLVAAILVRTFLLSVYVITGNSAAPEMPAGSHILVWKLSGEFIPGDIIAYAHDDKTYVGRVVRSTEADITVNRNAEPDEILPRSRIIGKVVSVYWRGTSPSAATPPRERLIRKFSSEDKMISSDAVPVRDAGGNVSTQVSGHDRDGLSQELDAMLKTHGEQHPDVIALRARLESRARLVSQSRVVRLYEVPDPHVEDCTVLYRAKVMTKNLSGRAYLEMWCRFPGMGEAFSRGLDQTITGSNDWISCQIPFFLKKGEKPDLIRLNLVIEGEGEVFVKDIELQAVPSLGSNPP